MLVASAALVGYNAVAPLAPAYDVVYVPLNLTAAVAVVAAGRRNGADAAAIGLDGATAAAGLRLGAGVAAVAAAIFAIAVAVPALHGLLDDARVAAIGIPVLLYRVLVRIPLGTVVLEEVAFRGVLLAALTRWQGTVGAVVGSSVVFGLWHIRPALELLHENELARSLPARLSAVAALVAFTAVAGVFFCVLRLRSRSLAAPLLAHAAINSVATVAAFAVRT